MVDDQLSLGLKTNERNGIRIVDDQTLPIVFASHQEDKNLRQKCYFHRHYVAKSGLE